MDGCLPIHLSSSSSSSPADYKLVSCSKSRQQDSSYQCSALNNHSITSGSSNQTELIRAYEFGRRMHQHQDQGNIRNQHLHGAEIHQVPPDGCHLNQNPSYFNDEEEEEYIVRSNASQVSESDTQTDPGIRQFTKSPPRPNETRMSACFATSNSATSEDKQFRPPIHCDHRSTGFEERETDESDSRTDDDDDDEDEDDEDEESDQVRGEESDRFRDVNEEESESESVLTASPASTCSGDERSSLSSVTPTNDQTMNQSGMQLFSHVCDKRFVQRLAASSSSDHRNEKMNSEVKSSLSPSSTSGVRQDRVMNQDAGTRAVGNPILDQLHQSLAAAHNQNQQKQQQKRNLKDHNKKSQSGSSCSDMQLYAKEGVVGGGGVHMTGSGRSVAHEFIDPRNRQPEHQQQHKKQCSEEGEEGSSHPEFTGSKVRQNSSSSTGGLRVIERCSGGGERRPRNRSSILTGVPLSSSSSCNAKMHCTGETFDAAPSGLPASGSSSTAAAGSRESSSCLNPNSGSSSITSGTFCSCESNFIIHSHSLFLSPSLLSMP